MLHRVLWKSADNFQRIFEKYYKYVEAYKPCIVVFDGYPSEHSTKSYERSKRSTKNHSNSMLFLSDNKECGVTQEDFLGNIENKKLLINRLTNIFQNSGVEFFKQMKMPIYLLL